MKSILIFGGALVLGILLLIATGFALFVCGLIRSMPDAESQDCMELSDDELREVGMGSAQ